MQSCHHIQKKISFFMEGEIPESEGRDIITHLRNCRLCQAESERSKKLEACLNFSAEVNPPSSIASHLMSSILNNELSKEQKRSIGMTQLMTVLAGILSIPLIAWFLKNIIVAPQKVYNFFFTEQGVFIKIIVLIVRTFSSLFNDSPLSFDLRFPFPTFQLLPFIILLTGILITGTIILSLFFSFTISRSRLAMKK